MKKKKLKIKKCFKTFTFYIYLIQIFMSLVFTFSIIKTKILNLKYLIPIILVVVFLDIILTFLLKRRKKKKPKKLICLLSILLSIIYLMASIFIFQFFSSMKSMFKNNSYINYSVIVLKNSNYKKVNNLDKKMIGFYINDKYNEKAKKVLNKNISFEYVGYSTINELKEALILNKIDGLLVMDDYLELDNLDDENNDKIENANNHITDIEKKALNNIKDFDEKTKAIFKFKIKVDNSKKSKKIDLEKGSFAIYVSGQDSYASSVSETSRSDVNMLMVVNVKTKQILLISIPRDYYINISSKNALDKLTHISLYGSDEAMKSIGNLLDVDVDYFIKFNFTTFMKAITYILPLDVYSDYDFTTSVYDQTIGNSYSFSKGYNHITDGKMALQFVRARKNFAYGDRQRGINQSRFLRAVINKASSPSVLLKYNKILKALEGTFLTNISNESIQEIARYVLNNNGSFNISSISLDGSDASRTTYSGGSQALYVMIPNTKTIEEAKVHIKTVLEGGVPDIELDASELADVKDTHTVTSKDIGKSYYYIPRNNSNTINSSNNELKNDFTSEKENDKDNPSDDENEEDEDKTNADDENKEEPKEPIETDSPTINPSPTPDLENKEENANE